MDGIRICAGAPGGPLDVSAEATAVGLTAAVGLGLCVAGAGAVGFRVDGVRDGLRRGFVDSGAADAGADVSAATSVSACSGVEHEARLTIRRVPTSETSTLLQ